MKLAKTSGLFGMIAPLLVWGAHLLFIYVVLAIACARRPDEADAVLPVLWFVTVAVLMALALLGVVQWRRLGAQSPGATPLVLRAGLWLTLIAAIAVIWAALPLWFVAPCA